jgi:hypothetical protein
MQAVFLQSLTGSFAVEFVELAPTNKSMEKVKSMGFMSVTINVEPTQFFACDANCG